MSDALEQVREHRAGLRAAIGRVERALAMPAPGRGEAWAKELGAELDGLSDALDQHIAITESPDGLLADIVVAAPRLSHRVDITRQEHVTLREKAASVRQGLSGSSDTAVAAARDGVVELLTALVRHRHLGADLVYEAYNVDIEAGD